MTRVELDEGEMHIVDIVLAQILAKVATDGGGRRFEPPDGIDTRRLAYQAEFAVAKHLDVIWRAGTGDIYGPDVGDWIEVRFRDRGRAARGLLDLVLYDFNHPFVPYVLAVEAADGVFDLAGWVWGWEAMQPQWWRAGQNIRLPAYFYRGPLQPIETLQDASYGMTHPNRSASAQARAVELAIRYINRSKDVKGMRESERTEALATLEQAVKTLDFVHVNREAFAEIYKASKGS